MILDSITGLAKNEKELAVLSAIKNAEKKKKILRIAFKGKVDAWVHEWAKKRGHKIEESDADFVVFFDYIPTKQELTKTIKKSQHVMIMFPSTEWIKFAKFSGRSIKEAPFTAEDIAEHGGTTEGIFYGLWKVAYFGFDKIKNTRNDLFLVFGFLALALFLTVTPYPPDDLLRHVKIHEYSYDYANLFAYSDNFSYNPYLLFDYFVGFLDQQFGEHALKIMQGLCFIVLLAGFYVNTKNWDWRFRIFVFVIMLAVMGLRIELARPTVFEAFFFLIALGLTGIPAVLFGVFMSSFYYLFFIFLIPLAFVRREYIISIVIGLLIWVYYAGFGYFIDIYMLISGIMTERVLPIGENSSVLGLLLNPFFLLLLYFFIKSKNYRYLIPIGLFTLINQIRFMDIIVPLIAISLIEDKIRKIKFGFVENILFLVIMAVAVYHMFPYSAQEPIHVENSTVFCDSMRCMFKTVYGSSNISISPSMEIGLTDREVQLQIKKMMDNGTVDCEFFEKYEYDLVVEGSLKEIPPCLELEDVYGNYRIWRTKR